jgi:hypothetical protein
LFPDRLQVSLFPSEVFLLGETSFPKKKTVERKTIPCDPAFGAEPWHGAIAALQSQTFDFHSKVSIILSDRFVRYAVLPWSGALAGAAEEQAYIRHHFAKIHGDKAKGWALRASPAGAGAPRLASAIDSALLEAIRKAFPGGGKAKLVSVQPQLMARFNAARARLPDDGAWLVLAEPERACVALHARGGWRSVQNAKGPWLALLERERYRVAGEAPSLVLLAGARAPAAPGAWRFVEIAA